MILSPAKINLSLSIKGRLKNGYHLISSHVVFLDLFDKININKALDNIVEVTGPYKNILNSNGGDTLIKKTLLLCQKKGITKSNFYVLLEKNIPVSGGLGGGSANSAAIIRYFVKHKYNLDRNNTQKFAKSIGADVPACIYSKPVLMTGIGEKLKFIKVKNNIDVGVVLINPQIQISTKQVFKNATITEKQPIEKKILEIHSVNDFYRIHKIGNGLKESALRVAPEIRNTLKLFENIDDCVCSGMSGSGPTCYGIFDSRKKAFLFEKKVKKIISDRSLWTWSGGLLLNSNRKFILPI